MKIYLAGKVHSGEKWKLFTEKQIKQCPIVASDGNNHSEHDFGLAYFDWECCMTDYKEYVKDGFIDEINGSGALIAYLNKSNSFGSIAEIAYAAAKNVPCVVFLVDSDSSDYEHIAAGEGHMFDVYWFVCSFPGVDLRLCRDFDDAKVQAQELMAERGWGYEPYADYLASDRWRQLRRTALQRAEFKCQLCGKNGEEMHVHHRTYANIQTDKEMSDLIVLCKTCHGTYHGKIDHAKVR
jgi:nucleoside 2-deoxyribosyltransferase